MVVGIGKILKFNRKCTIVVGLLFAVIFFTLIMVPSQADDDDSINKVSSQIAVDAVNPENTIGAQSDTYFDKVNQLLTVWHVNRGGVLNIGLSSSQDLTPPVITDFKVEPNTSVSMNNPAIASAYVQDENPFYVVFEFIDLNNLMDTDTMLLWYHINDSGINGKYFSLPWYANAWNITNGTVDDIATTLTIADWPDNIIILGNFTQNATSEEEEALLWFNVSTGNLNNVTRDDTVLTHLTIESGISTFKVFNIKFDIPEDEEGPTYTLYTIEHENNPYLVSTHVSTGTYEVGVFAEDNNSKNCSYWIEVEVDSIWPIINSVTLNTTTPNAGDDILITVNATDNVAVTSVEANGIALTHQGGDIWEGNIVAKEDYHIIYIKAIDAAGFISWNDSVAYFANNTLIGTDVQVEIPEIGATITFTNVIKSGQTYISEFNDDPYPPAGYNVLSNYYDIVTTAEYTGDITICIDYDDSEAVDEDKIKVLHYEDMEDETEIFALMQENINVGDTVWDLNGITYPDVLYGGSSESLHFVIDGTRLEINKSNFVYSTSIYDKNDEPFIAWLAEPMFVIESAGDWYLSELLVDEDDDDEHLLRVGETMTLPKGFAITPLEIDVDGEEAWFSVTQDGEEVESHVVDDDQQFRYETDLNESGDDDNWVLTFWLESVLIGMNTNLVKINSIQLLDPEVTLIETPDDDLFTDFEIKNDNNNALIIELDASDDTIDLKRDGIVNLICDKFRFKLDENGDTGGVLKRPDVTGFWKDVTSSLNTDTNIICGVVTNLSDFVIAEPIVDTMPTAILTQPEEGAYIRGTININGTANDTNFYNYTIEWKNTTVDWTEIHNSTVPVSDGTLATWNTDNLEDGDYSIRLIVADNAYNSNITLINVTIDNTPPTVTAYVIYEKGTAANNDSIITLNVSANDNLDGSGIKSVTANVSAVNATEVIALSKTGNYWISNIVVSATDGNHSVNITVMDNASNANYTQVNVTMDNIPPGVEKVNAEPNLINLSGTVNLTASICGSGYYDIENVSAMITYPNGSNIIYQMNTTISTSILSVGSIGGGSSGGSGGYGCTDYHLDFGNTIDPGRYNVTIIANDTTGNINDTQKTSFIVAHIYNTEITTNAGNSTFINASGTNITLELFTNDNITGSINITRSIVNITDELDVPGPGIYIRINASTNFSNNNYSNLSWALIKVNYTDEDVSNNSLEESTLRLYWYNKSSGHWIRLETNSPTWVYGSDVDIDKNYVWANVSRFSDYALGGALETPPPSNGDGDGGDGGGGGSSGGGASGELYKNIACSETD
ncbi:MAG: S-layer protein, partial [Candidatus Methanocomedens sp.]